jgi:hypothetical protein
MSSDVPQDPCREWLGIDAADLGDHRRVLGVAPEERDPLVVLRAAEQRLARLRSARAGSLEFVRTGFMKRVEAARESVLAEIAAAAPTAPAFRPPPAPSTLSPPPAVRHAISAVPAIPPAIPAAPPPVPRAAVPVPPVPPPPGAVAESTPVAPIVIRRTVYRKQTPVAGVAAALVGLSAVAGGLGYYALVVKPEQAARVAHAAREHAAAEADHDDDEKAVGHERSPAAADAAVDGDRPPPRARPRRPRSPSSDAAQVTASPATMAAREEDVPTAKPDQRSTNPPKGKAAAAKDAAKPKPAPGMSDEAAAEEAGRLDGTLGEVLAALRAGEDSTASRLLETAAAAVRGAPARDRLAGWQRLAESHGRFLEGRAAALDAVEPGARYEVGGRSVVIEKLDDTQCVYRASGPARTVAREKIPAGIVLAIVAGWFGDDTAGDLAIAAFQLAREEPEVRLAREHLEKARDAGADVDALLPLCEDPLFAGKPAVAAGR